MFTWDLSFLACYLCKPQFSDKSFVGNSGETGYHNTDGRCPYHVEMFAATKALRNFYLILPSIF